MPKTIFTVVLCLSLLPVSARGTPRRHVPAARTLQLMATAYCRGGKTESGARTRSGVIAADPRLLPIGSVVRIDMPNRSYSGIYTVLDRGGAVRGRRVDVFIADCRRARQFGRRAVRVRVLRRGWSPQAGVLER
jgi:3D (Asp-Asp-Asp) domain-containing protein